MVNYGNVDLLNYQYITSNLPSEILQYFVGVWSTKSTVPSVADNSVPSGE